MVKEGGIYAVHSSEKGLFQRNEDAPFFIRVKKVWKEQLGDISISDAITEGAKNRAHFKQIWKEINGDWDPEQEVFAVKFDVAFTTRKKREFLLYNSQHVPDPFFMNLLREEDL